MQNDEARMMYLKQSNQELAVQVEKLTRRLNRDQSKTATAERAVFQLEAQNVWLEAQLKAVMHENTKNSQQNHQNSKSPDTVVVFRDTSSAPPQMQNPWQNTTATATGMNITGNSLSLSLTLSEDSSLATKETKDMANLVCNGINGRNHLVEETQMNNDFINNQFSFPIMSSLPLSPPPSMPPPNQPRRSTYAEAITGGKTNTTSTRKSLVLPSTATIQKRVTNTYGTNPLFLEIRTAYHSVIASQAEEEDPIARWVRTVIAPNTSPIETDPKKVEPVLLGLQQLCEESGLPLPLRKIGSCQFQLGGRKSGGQKLSVRLINGRLMARSGPAWLDIFTWLERQPISIPQAEEETLKQ
jgi:hypothetical protein